MEGGSSAPKCQKKEPAAEGNSLERVELTTVDLMDVTDYLLELDATHILRLGQVLGLNFVHLTDMKGSHSFRDDMIVAWLRREDQVNKMGVPTWDTLVKALQNPRVNQNGIAKRIADDKVSPRADIDTPEGVTGGSQPGPTDLEAAKGRGDAPQQQHMAGKPSVPTGASGDGGDGVVFKLKEMMVVDKGEGKQEDEGKQSLIDWEWDDEVLHEILGLPEDEIYAKIMGMPIEMLGSQDHGPYRWRIINALAAVCRDDTKKLEIERKIRTIFGALNERDLCWLTEEQDNDGDTCLHSACNSRNCKTAELLLEFFPNECKKALQTLNKNQRTPLQVALNKNDWKTLQLLLSFCIRHKVCQELTGIRLAQHAKQCCTHGGQTTLMHEAMEKGFGVEYIKVFLPIIINELGEDAAKSSLVIYDEACNSAWFYVVERGDYKVLHSVLDEVKQRLPGISTSELYVNCKQQTILHQAYRDNLKRTIEELAEKDEELVDTVDANGKIPSERLHSVYPCEKKRRIDVSEWPTTHSVHDGIYAIPENVVYWEEEVHKLLNMPRIGNRIRRIPNEKLCTQDEVYGWTIIHALAAVCRDDTAEIMPKIRTIFQALKEKNLLSLAGVLDNDGDTPLHSASNSRNPETANLLLKFFPTQSEKALQTLNKLKRTPLHIALHKRDWETLKLLLKFSIKHKLCHQLIGLDPRGGETTLMHEAMKLGEGVQYLKSFLPMTITLQRENAAKLSLVIYDDVSNSAWFYLIEGGDPKTIKSVLTVVHEHLPDVKIIRDLHVNNKKQTMLHQAYRDNRKAALKVLQELEDGEELVDAEGKTPHEKSHSLH